MTGSRQGESFASGGRERALWALAVPRRKKCGLAMDAAFGASAVLRPAEVRSKKLTARQRREFARQTQSSPWATWRKQCNASAVRPRI